MEREQSTPKRRTFVFMHERDVSVAFRGALENRKAKLRTICEDNRFVGARCLVFERPPPRGCPCLESGPRKRIHP